LPLTAVAAICYEHWKVLGYASQDAILETRGKESLSVIEQLHDKGGPSNAAGQDVPVAAPAVHPGPGR
jgi:hypothetical protein